MDIFFRLIIAAVFGLTFAISARYRSTAREDGDVIARQEEGTLVLVLRMLLALPVLVSLLLYVVYPSWLTWSRVPLPIWIRVIACLFAVSCIPLIRWVFQNIGRNISETVLTKQDHQLVTSGPYHWVRHPLYASTLLMLGSFSLIAENGILFAYWALAVIIFRILVIPVEEQKLVEAFGDEYRDFQKRTGALLPKIF
jgi:protein-S-isoprenylcysteine O-methyltransferase Ste14